jgi:hypothetical protein
MLTVAAAPPETLHFSNVSVKECNQIINMQPESQQTQPHGWASLEERYEVMKEIGDGSFGSVALARVRTAGSHIARRGTLVCSTLRKRSGL